MPERLRLNREAACLSLGSGIRLPPAEWRECGKRGNPVDAGHGSSCPSRASASSGQLPIASLPRKGSHRGVGRGGVRRIVVSIPSLPGRGSHLFWHEFWHVMGGKGFQSRRCRAGVLTPNGHWITTTPKSRFNPVVIRACRCAIGKEIALGQEMGEVSIPS